MPSTPRTSTPYPAGSDAPNGPSQMQALAEQLEKYTLPRFASSAARDAAITAPAEGDCCVRTDTDMVQLYNGSGWVDLIPYGAPWITYTPTLTNVTLGTGGTVTGKYRRWGMDVEFEAIATLGSSGFSVGTGPTCSLPVTANSDGANFLIGSSTLFDATGPLYLSPTVFISSTTCEPRIPGTSGALAQITSTTPFTWAASDRIYFKGRYRANAST